MFHIDNEALIVFLMFALFLCIVVISLMRKQKDSELLGSALSQYASKDITQEILTQKWEVNLHGEKKKVTIFFSDIEWFTSLCEKLEAETLVDFLKEYLHVMSSNIQKYNGYIDKYEWDCIMAIWWAFHSMQKDSYDACLSAVKQQKALQVLNVKFKKTIWTTLKVRIWINTGDAILWNIWSSGNKLEYTALGDSVNIASRLDSVNKLYGTYICASEFVYDECIDFFVFRELDTVLLKWKDTGIKIFEIIDEIWKVDFEKEKLIAKYEEWLKHYYDWDYGKAYKIFKKSAKKDPPSATMKKRCEWFIDRWTPKNWTGEWRMK